jgi:tetratricopeptide (TPR) repeat protein
MQRALEPFENDELLALARLDLQQKRLDDAFRKLKTLMARPDAPAESFALAARLYRQLELPQRAQHCLRAYLEARPDALQESFELGVSHFEAGDMATADELWRGVLARQPAHPPALFYRGLLSVRESRFAEALERLELLFKRVPAENLYVTRGQALLQEIDPNAAAKNVTH